MDARPAPVRRGLPACNDAASGRRRRLGLSLVAAIAGLAACGRVPAPTEGALGACGDPTTAIARIQGEGESSPLQGQVVQVEAILAARLPGLDAVTLEAPPSAPPSARAGLLVMLDGAALAFEPGRRLRLAGTVTEWREQDSGPGGTRLRLRGAVRDCGPGTLPPPLRVEQAPPDWEALEGLRVHLPGPLLLAANYALAATGRATVALGPRPYAPTERGLPGPAAAREHAAQARTLLELDPARADPAADPHWWLGGAPGPQEPWRTGTTLADVEGVVVDGTRARLALTRAPGAVIQAPRPPPPPRTTGTLRVAAANVLNFFNGDGAGAGFPTARGAADAAAMQRQRDKVLAMLAGLDADVLALMEVENDGAGAGSALASLVEGLDAASGADGAWRAVDTGAARHGGDDIRVALVYRSDRVRAQGDPHWPAAAEFATLNRLPLAQAFVAADGGAPLVVVANHFKSKSGCPAEPGPDANAGDGQGCWNHTRAAAARALAAWIEARRVAEPAAWDAVLVVGDLNSHTQEDPVRALRDAGYIDLVERAVGPEAYSYVFEARLGRLDHALATPALAARVRAAGEWHLNADEAAGFAYDGDPALYRPDPWRASDHDPLWVDVDPR